MIGVKEGKTRDSMVDEIQRDDWDRRSRFGFVRDRDLVIHKWRVLTFVNGSTTVEVGLYPEG